jgi:hypothetical protein
MDLKFSKVERKGPVTIMTLSRPEVYNALHIDAHFELNKVFDDFAADPEQWVAIVTGAGDKAFCAGNDLKWQAAGGKRVETDDPQRARSVARAGDRRTARLSGGEGHGGVAGLHRGPEGVLGEAPAEVGGEIGRPSLRAKRNNPQGHVRRHGLLRRFAPRNDGVMGFASL